MSSEQPKPRPGHPAITELVIEDLKARTERGIETYGRPLEAFNGRDPLRDAYEEALDLSQYLRQALVERERISGDYVVSLEDAVLMLADTLAPTAPERRVVSALLHRIKDRRTPPLVSNTLDLLGD